MNDPQNAPMDAEAIRGVFSAAAGELNTALQLVSRAVEHLAGLEDKSNWYRTADLGARLLNLVKRIGCDAGLHCDPQGFIQPVDQGAAGAAGLGGTAAAPVAGRPAPGLSAQARKIVLAVFAALDLKCSEYVSAGSFQRQTALGVLDEFRGIVECIDAEFSLLLTPDNTLQSVEGRGSKVEGGLN